MKDIISIQKIIKKLHNELPIIDWIILTECTSVNEAGEKLYDNFYILLDKHILLYQNHSYQYLIWFKLNFKKLETNLIKMILEVCENEL